MADSPDPKDGFHPTLHHIPAADVDPETAQTAGMQRFAAISNAKVGSRRLWMGQTHVRAGMQSGDHHHGEAETAIYVVSGRPEFATTCSSRRTCRIGRRTTTPRPRRWW
jgi:uncharacterized RmlC-like cupin family protein